MPAVLATPEPDDFPDIPEHPVWDELLAEHDGQVPVVDDPASLVLPDYLELAFEFHPKAFDLIDVPTVAEIEADYDAGKLAKVEYPAADEDDAAEESA